MQVGALVDVDAPHRRADGAIERGVGVRIDAIGRDLGAVKQGGADEPAPLLLRERDVRLGQRGRLDLAAHQRIEPIARAVRGAAQLDHLARQESFQHVQGDVVGAEIERHADGPIGKLLRCVDR